MASRGPRPATSRLAVVAFCALCRAAGAASPPAPAVTKAPIFLPYYHEEAWSVVRGSVLSSNDKAGETTYTIFCPIQTPPTCDLALDFPFVVVEGPSTLQFHGTHTSTYIANVECKLDGRTAATCSGYTSFKSGYSNGPSTGPTEVSWTSTLSGPDVEWGTLTMAEKPTGADNFDVTASVNSAPTVASSVLHLPSVTGQGSGRRIHFDERLAMVAAAVVVCAAGLL
ncbi:hypothetical protein CDD83_6747 [Cordyceps sp. RAO-2017]|nr:hypothetical protein CDD83_6747 [Cordyceps sp. RAO-2017]